MVRVSLYFFYSWSSEKLPVNYHACEFCRLCIEYNMVKKLFTNYAKSVTNLKNTY